MSLLRISYIFLDSGTEEQRKLVVQDDISFQQDNRTGLELQRKKDDEEMRKNLRDLGAVYLI